MTRTALTGHEGHPAVVVNSHQVRCTPCGWLLEWPKPSTPGKPAERPTSTPPPFTPGRRGVPAASNPAWQAARKRFGRKPTDGRYES